MGSCIRKLVGNSFKVCRLQDYGQFLSLPTEIATLQDRRRKMGIALRVLQKGKAEK